MEKGSKKQIMFERMREKKKEVKVVRRIVLCISLYLYLLLALFVGIVYLSILMSGIEPLDPDSEEIIEVEIPIGSGLEFNCGNT